MIKILQANDCIRPDEFHDWEASLADFGYTTQESMGGEVDIITFCIFTDKKQLYVRVDESKGTITMANQSNHIRTIGLWWNEWAADKETVKWTTQEFWQHIQRMLTSKNPHNIKQIEKILKAMERL